MNGLKRTIGIWLFLVAVLAGAGLYVFAVHHGASGCAIDRVSGIDCIVFTNMVARAAHHTEIFQVITQAPITGIAAVWVFLALIMAAAFVLVFILRIEEPLRARSLRKDALRKSEPYTPLATGVRLWLARRYARFPRRSFVSGAETCRMH